MKRRESWAVCLPVCLSVRQFRLFACRLSCKQSWSKINWSILNEKKSSLLQAISVIYSLMSFYLQSEIALSLWTTIASTHFFLIVKGLNTVHKVVPDFMTNRVMCKDALNNVFLIGYFCNMYNAMFKEKMYYTC